jgi:hypothetical protein
MFVIWKVFAIPSRLIASVAVPPMSRPLNRTRPVVGVWSPETTLNKVDLPAPLGPITEKTWPRRTAKLTFDSAASAPKLFEMPSTSRITPSCAIGGRPGARGSRAGPWA